MIRFDCVTLFPEMFAAVTQSGITRRALEEQRWAWQGWNPRDFAENAWRRVDDRPFGGGPGMVMQAGPLERAIEAAKAQQREAGLAGSRVIYLSPQGVLLTHERVMRLASGEEGLILLCGRYEGVDERIAEHVADEEVCVGDYVLSGGEIPAMMLVDAVVRLLPGVIGNQESAATDSFSSNGLGWPSYTRPPEFRGWKVPEILLSGDHERIRRWRSERAGDKTVRNRPDLLVNRDRAVSG